MGGLGAIPFTAIDAWARRYRVADFELLRVGIRVMEGVAARHEASRRDDGGSRGRSADEKEAIRRAGQAG